VDDATRERVEGCTDLQTLDAWMRRAGVAAEVADVFADER
jgi:hypothetical protein